MTKHFMLMTAFFLGSALPAFAAPAACPEFATEMSSRVVAIFHDTTKSEVQKRTALSATFDEAVDTDWIGKFVLGRFWKVATPEQQAAYLKVYKAYLTHTYISKFNEEDGAGVDAIKVTGITPAQPNEFEAKSIIQQKGDDDVHVDYLLSDASGKCQVHDIKIEGVSLLATHRSEFNAMASSGGIDAVITKLGQLANAPVAR
jgi:phospholipid transport system substrate-binding protein